MKTKKPNKKKLEKMADDAWSKYVRNRDKHCKKCGGMGCLSAHHAFGRRHLATRWDVLNGITLCYPCHIHWAHHDSAGFTEWFRKHVGDCQYDRLAECHNQVTKHTTEELMEMLNWFKENKHE